MSEHTPGPWTVVANDDNELSPKTIREDRPDIYGSIIADEWFLARIWDSTGFNAAANAHLIAAAPDLLTALRDLCEADRDDLNDSTSQVWQNAIAAIAKAKGHAADAPHIRETK